MRLSLLRLGSTDSRVSQSVAGSPLKSHSLNPHTHTGIDAVAQYEESALEAGLALEVWCKDIVCAATEVTGRPRHQEELAKATCV